MLLTPWRDPGKSWFSPGDSGPGSPEPGRDAGLGFPQLWLIPGAGEGGGNLFPGLLVSAAAGTKACGVSYVPLWIL